MKHKIIFLKTPLLMHLDKEHYLRTYSIDFIGIFKLAGFCFGIGSDDNFRYFNSVCDINKATRLSCDDGGLIRYIRTYKAQRNKKWQKIPKIKFVLLHDEKILKRVQEMQENIKQNLSKLTKYYLAELKERRLL
jgi:hypothetical protein